MILPITAHPEKPQWRICTKMNAIMAVLITQGCFSYCWAVLTQSQGLFCSSHHPTSEEAGGAQEVWRGHSRDSWPQLTKGIFHTIWHHAQHIKLGEEEGRGGRSEWWRLSSQVTVTHDGALLSWRWLNACLPMGSGEWIPRFALLVHAAFALPVKLSFSQPMSSLTFTLPILSPSRCGGEWASGCVVVLSCQLGLNHNSQLIHTLLSM